MSQENPELSQPVTEIILQSYRKQTEKQYSTYLKKFESYCISREVYLPDANLSIGLDFLYDLHEKGLSYSAVNTARSGEGKEMCVEGGGGGGRGS